MALAMAAVGSIFLALVFASFGSTNAKDIPGTRGELAKDENDEPSWCSDLNELDCELNEEAKNIYCVKHCEEVVINLQKSFMIKFNKTYENEAEAEKRRAIFNEKVKKINEQNKLYKEGKSTFRMGINKFTDLTNEEFLDRYTGLDASMFGERSRGAYSNYTPQDIGEEPNYLDYRDMGAVSPVKDQTPYCGSCWAFAAVAPIESGLFLKTGELQQLSEQELLDCCEVCHRGTPCDGGSHMRAYDHIIKKGITFDIFNKYTAKNDSTCKRAPKLYPIEGVKAIRNYNEPLILNALVHMGPIAVAFEVSPLFEVYQDGIHSDVSCNTGNYHAVVIVGYGTENGRDYWIVRNSWGEDWGENGYVRMDRNFAAGCGFWAITIPIISSQ